MKLFAGLINGSWKIVSRVVLKQLKVFGLIRPKSTMSSTKAPLHQIPETTRVVIQDGKKFLQPSLNKWHQAVLRAESRRESGANYFDEVRQSVKLYMEDMKKPFGHHGC
ncbi:hypothetical protein D8674_025500 [Pyrus ussuriensis x Pyrus communis]|uniref:Uncharacterized protein n=1 Tax=Pyrus ussuriensis x Pyrus communis TaxID=2448454 RepID=A0A5N5HAW3_9ROSA|nr:hypothetical protein D8674_025454 [Pyrus ussuriensis x Pyrus communis]KAB2623318.1 hypothetical protein D8674_025500 [Pyrus ussuriensis x Pyrus communis]